MCGNVQTVLDVKAADPRTESPLRRERIRQQLSLRDLSFFVGCSHVTILRIEARTLEPSASLKARIARVLKVPVSKLWPPEAR